MNNLNLKNIVENLLDVFLEAGKIAKEFSRKGVKITFKSDNTPVTDGDLAVDQILRDKITNLTPEIPTISEETVNLKPIGEEDEEMEGGSPNQEDSGNDDFDDVVRE